MEDFITEDIKQRILKCMRVYGAEGLEDVIKDIYKNMPKMKELFLSEYYKIIRGEKDGSRFEE
jgi:hypothetical protein